MSLARGAAAATTTSPTARSSRSPACRSTTRATWRTGGSLTDDGAYDELTDAPLPVGEWNRCYLRASIDAERLQFSASPDGQSVGPVLHASKLSDDYGQGLHFSGAMVGPCAQDLRGTLTPADFDYFAVRSGGAGSAGGG